MIRHHDITVKQEVEFSTRLPESIRHQPVFSIRQRGQHATEIHGDKENPVGRSQPVNV